MSDIEFERRMNDQFAKNLFFFLNKYQYTQAAFAKQMNVSTATVSNWCNGLKSPRMDKIDHMCAIFNCSRSDLLEEKDIIRSQKKSEAYAIPVFDYISCDKTFCSTEKIIDTEEIPELSEQELEFIYDDKIRKVWHSQEEEWYFSIIDVIDVLTDSSDPKQYVKKLRSRDPELSANWGTICTPIQMIAADGKMRKIQATNTHGLLRIIQSIPSKKAEPFKQWLAMVGKQRLDEEVDPQIAIDRAIESYRNKGYSEDWIAQRMRGIEIRKDMTNEWRRAGITDSRQYASLTNILTAAWSGKTVKEYKKFKRLKKENLRDNMTNTELVLNALAEISTTEISKATNPQGITEATDATIQGGNIARNARESLEKQIGRSILSPLNSNTPKLLDDSKEK